MQNKPKFANFASDTKKSSEDEKKEFANSIIFNNLMGEGEKYLRDSLYDKSIKSYTKVKWTLNLRISCFPKINPFK